MNPDDCIHGESESPISHIMHKKSSMSVTHSDHNAKCSWKKQSEQNNDGDANTYDVLSI